MFHRGESVSARNWVISSLADLPPTEIDTAPQPAECCTEIGAETARDRSIKGRARSAMYWMLARGITSPMTHIRALNWLDGNAPIRPIEPDYGNSFDVAMLAVVCTLASASGLCLIFGS